MSLSLSAMAFLTSSFIATLYERSLKKSRNGVEASWLFFKRASSSSTTTTTTTTKHPSLTKEQIIELRQKHFLPSVSVSYANSGPLLILNGNGSRLIDEKGISYLDTRNNVAHVGHGNPYVVNAIQQQVAQLNTNTRYVHPNVVELAKRLTGKLPDPLEVVVFVNSGSEANDLALRLARAYTKSSNTIVVDRAYHGHTLATLEISPYKYEHSKEFTLKDNGKNHRPSPGHHIWKVPCPDTYRGKYRDKTNAGQNYAAYVEEACNYYTERNEKVGAFCIEGGMSVAGVILPPAEYLRKSVEAVRSAGGVYIADEVQTGFGRLGSSYWAFQHGNDDPEERGGGVIPDIVTVGKPFGNGMPLGAVITTNAIAEEFERMGVEYFNTFGGNPVSAAAGISVLEVMETEKLQEHALEVGTYIQTRFRKLKEEHGLDLIGDIRGSGLFVGVELVRDVKTLEPATAETSFICTRLKEKFHILTSIDGLYDNVLVVKPPLVFSKEDADYFVDSFEAASIELEALGNEVLKMKKTPT